MKQFRRFLNDLTSEARTYRVRSQSGLYHLVIQWHSFSKSYMSMLEYIHINTHNYFSILSQTGRMHVPCTATRTHTQDNQKPPNTLGTRGRSRVITSVRQEIPLCGWRLMKTHGARQGTPLPCQTLRKF